MYNSVIYNKGVAEITIIDRLLKYKMKSQLSGKKIFLFLAIMLLSTSVLHAVSADFFGTDTEAGEDSLRSKISSADASAVLFEYHFTSPIRSSAMSPIEVTGTDGSKVYVKISRGDPPAANFNGYTYPVGHAHDGYGTYYMDDWSVGVPLSASGWNEAITEGVKFEFFSDNAMRTPTTINEANKTDYALLLGLAFAFAFALCLCQGKAKGQGKRKG